MPNSFSATHIASVRTASHALHTIPRLTSVLALPLIIFMRSVRVQQNAAIVLLFSQLLLILLGGPMMVQCQGTNDHAAIELAHANPCADLATGNSIATNKIDSLYSTPATLATNDCVDTPLTLTMVLRHDERSSLEALPVLLTYQIAELPDLSVSAFGVSDTPTHIFSPDSAESLARNVILLI